MSVLNTTKLFNDSIAAYLYKYIGFYLIHLFNKHLYSTMYWVLF